MHKLKKLFVTLMHVFLILNSVAFTVTAALIQGTGGTLINILTALLFVFIPPLSWSAIDRFWLRRFDIDCGCDSLSFGEKIQIFVSLVFIIFSAIWAIAGAYGDAILLIIPWILIFCGNLVLIYFDRRR